MKNLIHYLDRHKKLNEKNLTILALNVIVTVLTFVVYLGISIELLMNEAEKGSLLGVKNILVMIVAIVLIALTIYSFYQVEQAEETPGISAAIISGINILMGFLFMLTLSFPIGGMPSIIAGIVLLIALTREINVNFKDKYENKDLPRHFSRIMNDLNIHYITQYDLSDINDNEKAEIVNLHKAITALDKDADNYESSKDSLLEYLYTLLEVVDKRSNDIKKTLLVNKDEVNDEIVKTFKEYTTIKGA